MEEGPAASARRFTIRKTSVRGHGVVGDLGSSIHTSERGGISFRSGCRPQADRRGTPRRYISFHDETYEAYVKGLVMEPVKRGKPEMAEA